MRKIYEPCGHLRGKDEWQGSICRCPNGDCIYTQPRLGKSGDAAPPCEVGTYEGGYHCHPPEDAADAYFSLDDSATVIFTKKPVYLLVSPGLVAQGEMKKLTTNGQPSVIGHY